jgi:hypothetical protein
VKTLKYLSVISFFLFYHNFNYGQAAIDILLVATETTYTQQLRVGLDLTATTCLDPHLGELEIPPMPPGNPLIGFDLAPYGCGPITVWEDYRNAQSLPFTGVIQHTLFVQRTSSGTPISIQYSLPNEAQMTITDAITGTIYSSGVLTGAGTFVITGIGLSLSTFWFTMNYMAIVPVELTSFTADVLETTVILDWSTATETNNSGFEIQRKESGDRSQNSEYEVIGFVPGFGTTSEPKSYSFTDESVTTGTYKYRLKQIDFDGSFEYSNEIEVEIDFTPKEFVLYQNYPNPFNPTTTIKFEILSVIASEAKQSQLVTLKIYDSLGNDVSTLVNEEKQPGVYEVEFDSHSDESQNLSSGIYFYQLKAGQYSETKKMILLR